MPTPPGQDELIKLKGRTRTVAQLLEMFGRQVRDQAVVLLIRNALDGASLTTVPSFDTAAHDEELHFVIRAEGDATSGADEQAPSPVPGDASTRAEVLPAATRGLVSVEPGTSLDDAIALMMSRHLSQVPVLEGESKLCGMVTWRSIWAMRVRGHQGTLVEDAFDDEDIPIARPVDKLLTVLDQVCRYGYVLVHTGSAFSGIITYPDIVEHFGAFAAPFFAIGEIERRLRTCVERHFDEADIAHTGVNATTFAKFTLGSYWHFFKSDQNWEKLGWQFPQQHFLAMLNRVVDIRNDVMHFNPSLLTPEKLKRLEEFAGLLRSLVP